MPEFGKPYSYLKSDVSWCTDLARCTPESIVRSGDRNTVELHCDSSPILNNDLRLDRIENTLHTLAFIVQFLVKTFDRRRMPNASQDNGAAIRPSVVSRLIYGGYV